MVDPRTTALSRGDGPEGVYLAELGKTSHLSRLADAAALAGGPWGWDASMYVAERPAGDTWLLIGDAASFIDPLSSAGVKKAMASGWLAAVAVNTALGRPAPQGHGLRVLRGAGNRDVRPVPGADAAAPARRRPVAAPLLGRAWRGPATRRRRAPSVQAALDRIRADDDLALRIADGVRFEARPALTEREIVLERQLVTQRRRRGGALPPRRGCGGDGGAGAGSPPSAGFVRCLHPPRRPGGLAVVPHNTGHCRGPRLAGAAVNLCYNWPSSHGIDGRVSHS